MESTFETTRGVKFAGFISYMVLAIQFYSSSLKNTFVIIRRYVNCTFPSYLRPPSDNAIYAHLGWKRSHIRRAHMTLRKMNFSITSTMLIDNFNHVQTLCSIYILDVGYVTGRVLIACSRYVQPQVKPHSSTRAGS